MPQFEIEQYELHIMKYQIEAKDEAEAIARVLDGETEPVDNSLEFVEVAQDIGLSAEEHGELAKELRKRGVPVDEAIPSIRSVVNVWGQE